MSAAIHLPRSHCRQTDRCDIDALCCVGHYVDRRSGATKRLYVTSVWGASNIDTIKDEGITLVLNVSEDDSPSKLKATYARNGISFDHMCMYDIESQDIVEVGKKSLIQSDRTPGSTLIHCQMGVSRSIAIACYIMMSRSQDTLENIINEIKHVRSIASPNDGFVRQLETLEETIARDTDFIKIDEITK